MDNIIWARIKQDYWVYIVVMLALIITLYSLSVIKDYENQCNEHWRAEMDKCRCAYISQPAQPWDMPNYTLPIQIGGIT